VSREEKLITNEFIKQLNKSGATNTEKR